MQSFNNRAITYFILSFIVWMLILPAVYYNPARLAVIGAAGTTFGLLVKSPFITIGTIIYMLFMMM
ncbi:MAG: hypothetical protein ACRCX2_30055 [Paraclostridium sp.]